MVRDTESVDEPIAEEDCFLQLRDRTPVIVHRARARDRAEVIEFVERLSVDSLELRFSGPVRAETVTREILGASETEPRLSLLMETLEEVPRVVGNAEYVRYRRAPDRAEVAFLIADAFQGRGAGALLLHELARRARPAGIRWFTAVVMAENVAMRDVFLRSGFPYRVVCDGPTMLIELRIGDDGELRAGQPPSRVGPIVPAGWGDAGARPVTSGPDGRSSASTGNGLREQVSEQCQKRFPLDGERHHPNPPHPLQLGVTRSDNDQPGVPQLAPRPPTSRPAVRFVARDDDHRLFSGEPRIELSGREVGDEPTLDTLRPQPVAHRTSQTRCLPYQDDRARAHDEPTRRGGDMAPVSSARRALPAAPKST
jgi:RimJ/RimL family protein N-acetyltransferase